MKFLQIIFLLSFISCGNSKSNKLSGAAPDVYYPISPLKQPKSNDCWITSLTILKRWKDPNINVDGVIDQLGEPYNGWYTNNKGLPGDQIQAFYTKAGVSYDQPQNYTMDGWIANLKQHGPSIVDVFSFIDPVTGTIWTHARVLVGIEKKDPEVSSDFIFIDPANGTETVESFGKFLEHYEAVPGIQDKHIQVAYLR